MTKSKKILVYAFTLILLLSCTFNTKVYAATSNIPKTAAELVADMKIGWNLGNSLDAMNKGKGYTFNTETI